MELITRRLQTEIPVKELTQIEDWWNKLSAENQTELEALYLDEEKHQDNIIYMTLDGEFVEHEKEKGEDAFWMNYFYDYVVNHELMFWPSRTTYYVCSSNSSAEAVIRKAFLPKGYICPLQEGDCPMTNMLKESPGKSIELRIKFKLKKSAKASK